MALAGGGSRRKKFARKIKTDTELERRQRKGFMPARSQRLQEDYDRRALRDVKEAIAEARKAARLGACVRFREMIVWGHEDAEQIFSMRLRKAAEEALEKSKKRGEEAGCSTSWWPKTRSGWHRHVGQR